MPRPPQPRTIGSEDSLALRVQREREKREWSPAGLAERMTAAGCPMSQSAIWKIENGEPRRRITVDEAVAFANVFEVSLENLLVDPDVAMSEEAVQAMGEIHDLTNLYEDVADKIDKAWDRLADAIGNPATHTRLRAELAARTEFEPDGGEDPLDGWIDWVERRQNRARAMLRAAAHPAYSRPSSETAGEAGIDGVRMVMEALRSRRVDQHASDTPERLVEANKLVQYLDEAPSPRWGELQLRRIVEAADVAEHCDFRQLEDGPDVVVRLSGGKGFVIDAKVSVAGWREAVKAREVQHSGTQFAAHVRQVRDHIDKLASKKYREHLNPTPEFVVMFVPAEMFLTVALDEEPALLEHAFQRRVVVATPQTLVALLRTVTFNWRQHALVAEREQLRAELQSLKKSLEADDGVDQEAP